MKDKIIKILQVMETGSIEPRYDKLTIFADGPRHNGSKMKQITYGRLQTTEFGHLNDLITYYLSLDGKYDNIFEDYIDKIGKVQLWNDSRFKQALLDAARNDPAMVEAQDWLFDNKYWVPAMRWASANGFKHPLSHLIIFDSFIHSGSIMMFLRRLFLEKVPLAGGDEKKWIAQYIETRHNWLKNHSDPILRKTIYRTKDYIREVNRGNWDLSKPVSANGIIVP